MRIFGINVKRFGNTLVYPIYEYTTKDNKHTFKFEFDGSSMTIGDDDTQRNFLRPSTGPRLYNGNVMDVYYQLILK